ncbi:hypothetical protein POG22_08755 [Geitlerinema sp. CS-897]|nr:hypothetical protein [Geitlerinema sp. CS-897]
MGGHPWYYFTTYQADINAVLQALREQEFRAGRYGSSYLLSQSSSLLREYLSTEEFEKFSNFVNQPRPSADDLIKAHGSVRAAMEAVLEASEADGTQSILDILHVSEEQNTSSVCPLSDEELQAIFQTTEPTHKMIESILLYESEENSWETFWDSIERGEGRYIIVYKDGKPVEIFFAGYSFD